MEEQIKSQVRNSFIKLKNAIELREKLLLRQIEVFNKFSKGELSDINFLIPNEEETLTILRNYGSYQNIESFLPFLENENEEEENFKDIKCLKNDLDNIDNKLSESIINLTVKDSQDLIKKSSDLKVKTDDLVSQVQQKLKIILPSSKQSDIDKTHNNQKDVKSIKQTATTQKDVKVKESESKLKRNGGTTSSKKKVLKNISNLTLNSCGTGNIILKNISNLTINTCKTTEPENDSVGCKDSKKCDIFYPQCDFYEKLISENEALKKTIVHQSVNCTTYPDPITAVCMSPKDKNDGTFSINSASNETSASSIIEEAEDGFPAPIIKVDKSRKSEIGFVGDLPLEEISARNANLAENMMGTHSPIIQCWLSKMCLETELENNIEILEFSNIVS